MSRSRSPSAETAVPTAARTGRSSSRSSRTSQKGQQTRQFIVESALSLATQMGLEGLSIGAVAELVRMSKSGVFAHFGSREELQMSVIREYFSRFEQEIFYPAMREPRGLPRLQALFANWMKRVTLELQSGCIFISGAVEFDDRPGPVRDALVGSVNTWLAAVHRAVVQAKAEGHLGADTDEHQMAFEIHGLILGLHYEARFLKRPGSIARAHQGFASILSRHGRAQTRPSSRRASSLSSSSASSGTSSPSSVPSSPRVVSSKESFDA